MVGNLGFPTIGREEGSRGTFMEWFPWRAFACFRRAAKEGHARRHVTSPRPVPVPAAAGKNPPLLRIHPLSLLAAASSRRLRRARVVANCAHSVFAVSERTAKTAIAPLLLLLKPKGPLRFEKDGLPESADIRAGADNRHSGK